MGKVEEIKKNRNGEKDFGIYGKNTPNFCSFKKCLENKLAKVFVEAT